MIKKAKINLHTNKLFKHCELCKNKAFNIEKGVFCKLTNKNPDFNTTCNKIVFNENLETRIKEINIKFEETKREKKWAYSYFVTFFVLSLTVLFFTYKFNNYISNILSKASGRPVFIGSSLTIIFICISIVLLGYAFGALNRHHFESKKNTTDKLELDAILKLYKIDYDIKINFKDRLLMSTDIKTELKLKKPQSLDV
jgi:hypothetical protein